MNVVHVPAQIITELERFEPIDLDETYTVRLDRTKLSFDELAFVQHVSGHCDGSGTMLIIYFINGSHAVHSYVDEISSLSDSILFRVRAPGIVENGGHREASPSASGKPH